MTIGWAVRQPHGAGGRIDFAHGRRPAGAKIGHGTRRTHDRVNELELQEVGV